MNSLRNSLVTLTLDIITRIKGKSHVHSSHLNCSVNFSRRLKSKNHLVQDNKQYHRKVLLSSFHLNGHTLGFHPQTQKLQPPLQHNKHYHRRVQLSSFHLNGHTIVFHSQTQKLEPPGTI